MAPPEHPRAPHVPGGRSAAADALPELLEAAPRAARRPRPVGARVLPSLAKVSALWLFAYTFVFNFSVVRGSSMAPGILDGDRIVVDHVTHRIAGLHRGDIIVLRYPVDPSIDYIKRVVGLPGDEVRIDGGSVWVNGDPIEEPYVERADVNDHVRVRVRPGHCYVLGDNRPRSSDSREFGQVPLDSIRGRVNVRVWPPSRLGLL